MKASILLIEDNEQNSYLASFLLQSKGHSVDSVASGRAGLAEALRGRYDLVLLDIQLPEMDGYTVARLLRAESRLADVPIVAVTSYAMVGDREQALAAGCTGYIEKPIVPETFVEQVEAHLPDNIKREDA